MESRGHTWKDHPVGWLTMKNEASKGSPHPCEIAFTVWSRLVGAPRIALGGRWVGSDPCQLRNDSSVLEAWSKEVLAWSPPICGDFGWSPCDLSSSYWSQRLTESPIICRVQSLIIKEFPLRCNVCLSRNSVRIFISNSRSYVRSVHGLPTKPISYMQEK